MKEAPEKIFLVIDPVWGSMSVNYNRNDTNNIEYTRTDTFIEKACDAYCKVCKMPNCRRNECNWISYFKEHLKTI